MSASTKTRIVVQRRPGGYRDRVRKYTVLVDGVRRGAVGAGEKFEVDVAPGTHTVQARIDWSGSPEVSVEVPEGRKAHFLVEPNGGVLSQLVQVFTRSGWIKVTPRPLQ